MLPTTVQTTVPTTTMPPFECLVDGDVITYFNRSLRSFQGTFEICIRGFYGSVCDIGWNQTAAQTLCDSQYGSGYSKLYLY